MHILVDSLVYLLRYRTKYSHYINRDEKRLVFSCNDETKVMRFLPGDVFRGQIQY